MHHRAVTLLECDVSPSDQGEAAKAHAAVDALDDMSK